MKTINISDELETDILAFCDDELNYHIHSSCCAEDYETEILAQIQLLRLLGHEEMANRYENDYKEYLKEHE